MEFIKIFVATIVGTSLMTAFSYVVSEAYKKVFKEPVLLQYIMRMLRIEVGTTGRSILGWALHYFIGLIFILCYEFILRNFDLEFDIAVALVFGTISGIAGILGWMVIFRLPSDEPNVDYKKYYIQLFFAHIIFALGVYAVYKLFP